MVASADSGNESRHGELRVLHAVYLNVLQEDRVNFIQV